MAPIFGFRKDLRGFSLVSSMALAGAIGLGAMVLFKMAASRQQVVVAEAVRFRADEAARKAVSLGSYLVAVNLIGCREQGWVDDGKKKCRWLGDYFNPKIDLDAYNLKFDSKSEDEITFKIDKLPMADGRPVDGWLTFRLVEWADSDNGLVDKFLPLIPFEQSKADNDRFMVIVEAKIDLSQFTAMASVGIRRPLGLVSLTMKNDPGGCPAQCVAGSVQSPDPECRGPQEVPDKSTTTGNFEVVNSGPGIIYNLTMQKEMNLVPEFFPELKPEKLREVSKFTVLTGAASPADQMIVPNMAAKQVSDTFPCMMPINRVITTSLRGRGPTQVSTSTHQEPFSNTSYNLDIMPWNPKYISWSESQVPSYNMNKSSTYPKGEKNKFLAELEKEKSIKSAIEPQRLGRPYRMSDVDQSVSITTTIIVYMIPSH